MFASFSHVSLSVQPPQNANWVKHYISPRLNCILMYYGNKIIVIVDIVVVIVWNGWRHQMETISALLTLCAGNWPANYPHKGQWRGALRFSLICAWTNDWVNNLHAGDLRGHRAHYYVTAMSNPRARYIGVLLLCLIQHVSYSLTL